MAFKNLTNEQAAQLAQTLGLEFTASAEKDLINFADVLVGFVAPALPEVKTFVVKEQVSLEVEKASIKTKDKK